jgi:hypothetical protein
MNAYAKVRLKIFALNLTFELILNGLILFTAYLCDKFLLTALFYIPFHGLRYAFPKIFHAKGSKPLYSLMQCAMLSYLCYLVAMKLMLPLNISIFSGVIVGVLINYILYKIEDYLELKRKSASLLFRLCQMSEDDLRSYAISKHISETMVDTLVLRLKHNYRWCEIREARAYSKDGIRYHKETLERILGVKL